MTSLEAVLGVKPFYPTSAPRSSQKGMRMVRSPHEASRWHGLAELGEEPSQSLIQSPPRSDGKVCFNFAEVLKQTVDLDRALGKCNAGARSPFSASTVRLELASPPPQRNAGTSAQFLKSKPSRHFL